MGMPLADVCGELGRDREERACLLAAMVTDPNDPVTSEAIRSQLRRGMSLVGAGGGEEDGDGRAASALPSRSRTPGE